MPTYKEIPCTCGFTPEHNKNEFECFQMKMGTIMEQELPTRKTWRCKHCKDVCLIETKINDYDVNNADI